MRASKLLYYDRAGVSKGTLAGGTQFGTPNDLKDILVKFTTKVTLHV